MLRRLSNGRCFEIRSFSTNTPITIVKEGNVGVLHLNDSGPVNVGNKDFMEQMPNVWETIQNDSEVEAIVLYSEKPGNFFAGADISMLGSCETKEDAAKLSKNGQDVLNLIERSTKPVVAAINGSCMGLGTELVLACHYRIATLSPKTVLSLPEVQLGLLPGAGGTQRLPRLVGLPNSLPMMLTGQQIRMDKARKMGLVDETIAMLGPGLDTPEANTMRFLRSSAVKKASELAKDGKKSIKRKEWGYLQRFLTFTSAGRAIVMKMSHDQVEKQTHGNFPAPLKILECVEVGLTKGMAAGYLKEQKEFGALVKSPESAALRSIFFATQTLKKNRFGKPKNECKTVGVIGAGLMGAGIADVSLNKAKMHVLLKDATQEGLIRGEIQISKSLDKMVQRRIMSNVEKETRLAKLDGLLTYEGFEKTDLVIEAVFEDLKVKHNVIAELERVVPKHCVIATNTSAIPITDIASKAQRPENIVGMHYFSPVEKMPLLEIITHAKTSNDTAAQAVSVGLKQGKTVIVVKDGPGFYTTRILLPFIAEAFALLQEGVSVERLDKVVRKFGFPVGPCVLTDEVGIDVGYHIAQNLRVAFPTRFCDDMSALGEFVSSGLKGRKSGAGFYTYDNSKSTFIDKLLRKPSKTVNPLAVDIIKKHSKPSAREISDKDICYRMVGRMANEAVECLQDSILSNATDGDIGAVFGLGFPPYLGGPFRWIDHVGAKKLVSHLREYEGTYGPQFKCAKLLQQYAESGMKFHQ